LRYLRPFALQGDAGFEIALDSERTTTFAYNFCLQYSIPYLQAFVRDVGLEYPFDDLIPVTEFNFESGVHGPDSGTTSAIVTPGIVYMDRYVEIGVAGRFPMNEFTHRDLDWGVIGIVDLFIDDIFPFTKWQPF